MRLFASDIREYETEPLKIAPPTSISGDLSFLVENGRCYL